MTVQDQHLVAVLVDLPHNRGELEQLEAFSLAPLLQVESECLLVSHHPDDSSLLRFLQANRDGGELDVVFLETMHPVGQLARDECHDLLQLINGSIPVILVQSGSFCRRLHLYDREQDCFDPEGVEAILENIWQVIKDLLSQ